MLAFFVPVVEAGQERVLVIEVVVEDHYQRCGEGELLGEGLGAFEVKFDGGGDSGESDRGGSFFRALRGPFVVNRDAIRMDDESAGYVRGAFG